METVINLGNMKETNAAEVKIDELAKKIKALSALEDTGARATAMLYMNGESEKGEMNTDAYIHGNTLICVTQMRSVLASIIKNSAKSPEATASLLLKSALDLLCEAAKVKNDPAIRDAVASAAKAAFEYM